MHNTFTQVADPVMGVQYDTRYDSKETAPRAQQYFYQYCPEEENEGAWALLSIPSFAFLPYPAPSGVSMALGEPHSTDATTRAIPTFSPTTTALLKVYAPSTTIVQAVNQVPKAAPANTINAYSVTINAKDPVFVVGASVKGESSARASARCGFGLPAREGARRDC